MNLYFQQDWSPLSYKNSMAWERSNNFDLDHVSFGHDIETAYLLLEATNALGNRHDTITLRVAKNMVDHTMNNGWDKSRGGIFDGGYYNEGVEHAITIVKETKEFWTQVEALNSFLMMSQLFPGDSVYYYKFLEMWDYNKKYVIDNHYGGWYWRGSDTSPEVKYMAKADIWKADYHTSRAMINCLRRLDHTKKDILE